MDLRSDEEIFEEKLQEIKRLEFRNSELVILFLNSKKRRVWNSEIPRWKFPDGNSRIEIFSHMLSTKLSLLTALQRN